MLFVLIVLTTLVFWAFAAHYAAKDYVIRYFVFGLITILGICLSIKEGIGLIGI